MQYVDLPRTSRLNAHDVGTDDPQSFCAREFEQFLTARPSILITDCKSLYDAIHKEGAAPASTDKRSAIELAIVKAKAVFGVTDLRWIDARYQIADCFTKHASRKS